MGRHAARSSPLHHLSSLGTPDAGLLAPVYFKHAVDAMGTRNGAAITAAVAALLTSGLCRIVNGVAKELQHPFFTPVSQARGGRGAAFR